MIETEDVEDFKKYCKNIFENQLQMDSNKTNVLIIDSPHHSKEYRNKMAEWFFEGLRVASINFLNSSVLSLFSTGMTEGLVIEMGHGRTSVVPIYGVICFEIN
jgi:actin-related protein